MGAIGTQSRDLMNSNRDWPDDGWRYEKIDAAAQKRMDPASTHQIQT